MHVLQRQYLISLVPVPILRTYTGAAFPTSEVMPGGSRVSQVKPRKWRQRKCTPGRLN